jgi:hypothetical protein
MAKRVLRHSSVVGCHMSVIRAIPFLAYNYTLASTPLASLGGWVVVGQPVHFPGWLHLPCVPLSLECRAWKRKTILVNNVVTKFQTTCVITYSPH